MHRLALIHLASPMTTSTGVKWLKLACAKASTRWPGALLDHARLLEGRADLVLGEGADVGKVCEVDLEKSLAAYKAAAALGCVDAIVRLGYAQAKGELGLPLDASAAQSYFRDAAARGSVEGMLGCAEGIVGRLAGGGSSREVREEAGEEALGWVMEAVSGGVIATGVERRIGRVVEALVKAGVGPKVVLDGEEGILMRGRARSQMATLHRREGETMLVPPPPTDYIAPSADETLYGRSLSPPRAPSLAGFPTSSFNDAAFMSSATLVRSPTSALSSATLTLASPDAAALA
ncbi:hypothetical protein HK101_005604, partial [Irineochytrium annulatum]